LRRRCRLFEARDRRKRRARELRDDQGWCATQGHDRGCLDRIQAAWNAGDAGAFAGSFTEDATYGIFLGEALIATMSLQAGRYNSA
jgi:hypothetical protein